MVDNGGLIRSAWLISMVYHSILAVRFVAAPHFKCVEVLGGPQLLSDLVSEDIRWKVLVKLWILGKQNAPFCCVVNVLCNVLQC